MNLPVKIDLDSIRPPTDWKSIYVVNVVAFLSSVQMGSIIPTIWPYMRMVQPSLTENTYGIMRGTSALANIVCSGIVGYLANRWGNTKYLIIFGKVVGILGSICYLLIEVEAAIALALFLAFEILHGGSAGITSVYRTHISMNTLDSERSKAFGLTSFAFSLGLAIGPLLQMLFTLFGYPGWNLIFGIHWNLYTAPVFLSFFTTIVGILLLLFFFNGKLHVKPKVESSTPSRSSVSSSSEVAYTAPIFKKAIIKSIDEVKYDKVAMFVMIFFKVAADISMLCIMSILSPYTMTAFAWTSKQAVSYQSAMMAGTGSCSLLLALAYVFFRLDKRVSERLCLLIGFCITLVFYVLTFPWPFIKETIPYEHVAGGDVYYTQSVASAAKEILKQSNATLEFVGCSVNYSWCEETPRINLYLYMITLVTAVGVSIPLIQINLDILFSKILGPIKQGVHQAIFFASGQVLNIVGPVVMTKVYTVSGPRWIWMFEIVFSVLCILTIFFFYGRLIPYSKRVENKMNNRNNNKSNSSFINTDKIQLSTISNLM